MPFLLSRRRMADVLDEENRARAQGGAVRDGRSGSRAGLLGRINRTWRRLRWTGDEKLEVRAGGKNANPAHKQSASSWIQPSWMKMQGFFFWFFPQSNQSASLLQRSPLEPFYFQTAEPLSSR